MGPAPPNPRRDKYTHVRSNNVAVATHTRDHLYSLFLSFRGTCTHDSLLHGSMGERPPASLVQFLSPPTSTHTNWELRLTGWYQSHGLIMALASFPLAFHTKEREVEKSPHHAVTCYLCPRRIHFSFFCGRSKTLHVVMKQSFVSTLIGRPRFFSYKAASSNEQQVSFNDKVSCLVKLL